MSCSPISQRLAAAYRAATYISFHAGLLALLLFSAGVAGAAATKKPPAHPINLNSASAAELQQVPGIGPSTAGKILQMRKTYGPFRSVDDLLAVRGIGRKRLDKMRKYLTVGRSLKSAKPQARALPSSAPKSSTQAPPH